MKKKINLLWSISLIVIGIATLILVVPKIIGLDFPDLAIRIIGVVDLIAIPVLAYTTVKIVGGHKNEKENSYNN